MTEGESGNGDETGCHRHEQDDGRPSITLTATFMARWESFFVGPSVAAPLVSFTVCQCVAFARCDVGRSQALNIVFKLSIQQSYWRAFILGFTATAVE